MICAKNIIAFYLITIGSVIKNIIIGLYFSSIICFSIFRGFYDTKLYLCIICII